MSSDGLNIAPGIVGLDELIPEPTGAFAMIAEFRDVDAVMHASEKIRDAGYLIWDVHSPFPIHGISKAMGLHPTILPWIALVHGVIGALLGVALVWWANATTIENVPAALQGYEYLVSGKPRFSLVANIPIIFEMAVLFAAFGTILGMLGLNKLPMLANPLFRSRRFRSVTRDGLFIVIESQDKYFMPAETQLFLRHLGATAIEFVIDDRASPAPRSEP
jgi:hypothetical protein